MNVLTFDIEEWYIEEIYYGGRKEKYAQFDCILNQILQVLDEQNFKATFFCLGKMATNFPEIIKLIDKQGHEIGCHSDKHLWLNKHSKEVVKQDTCQAVDALEQCIGKKMLSYRAPAFSIGENNLWVFEILAYCGIERDSSIFPANRDFGGFSSFNEKVPTLVSYNGIEIKEFPIPTKNIFGKNMAYSGGGYFRFFPLSFISKQLKNYPYSITYFHVGDLLPEINKPMSKKAYEDYFKEKGTFLNRYKRYIKSNLGTLSAFNKMIELLKTDVFTNLAYADSSINWSQAPKVEFNY